MKKLLAILSILLCSCGKHQTSSVSDSGVSQISAGGNFTFIIRDNGKPLDMGSGNGDTTNNELWLKNDATGKKRLLVTCKDEKNVENEVCNIGNPRFSLDRSKVYFESSAWATSDAIHVVDLKTGKEKFLCPGNGLKVIKFGKFKGDFITTMHKYYGPPNYGSYDHNFVVDENGKELLDLGDVVEAAKLK